ncbi:SRPBCC family protein [Lacinutrix salivirga]
MKYSSEIIIELKRDDVLEKLNNLNNLKHWQEGLISFEHVSGSPGAVGSKMKLNYVINNRKMSLIESVTHKELPEQYHFIYDTKGMHNIQKNFFTITPQGYTKWTAHSEFVATNLKMRILTLLMPKLFKKQSMKYMEDFKNFAEKGHSVQHA